MNIEEYRAMKAQIEEEQQNSTEKEQADVQTQQTATDTAQSTTQTETQGESTQPTGGAETEAPSSSSQTEQPKEITLDGETYKVEDVKRWKDGHMMQSDYTKKTQELAKEKREVQQALQFMQQLQANPDMAKQLSQELNMPQLDPEKSKVLELENKYHDLLLEKEINELTAKYEDFNPQEVLQLAFDKKLNNLEDAYLLSRSKRGTSQETKGQEVDVDSIKEQIRQELLKELQSEKDTSSIIQSGGEPVVKDDSPKLSTSEVKVAKAMGMSPKEYAKWRNKK
jgi:hypothetical protein